MPHSMLVWCAHELIDSGDAPSPRSRAQIVAEYDAADHGERGAVLAASTSTRPISARAGRQPRPAPSRHSGPKLSRPVTVAIVRSRCCTRVWRRPGPSWPGRALRRTSWGRHTPLGGALREYGHAEAAASVIDPVVDEIEVHVWSKASL